MGISSIFKNKVLNAKEDNETKFIETPRTSDLESSHYIKVSELLFSQKINEETKLFWQITLANISAIVFISTLYKIPELKILQSNLFYSLKILSFGMMTGISSILLNVLNLKVNYNINKNLAILSMKFFELKDAARLKTDSVKTRTNEIINDYNPSVGDEGTIKEAINYRSAITSAEAELNSLKEFFELFGATTNKVNKNSNHLVILNRLRFIISFFLWISGVLTYFSFLFGVFLMLAQLPK